MSNEARNHMQINRRGFVALTGAMALSAAPAQASGVDAGGFGVVPNSEADQTDALQAAIDAASAEGKALQLDAGAYQVRQLALRSDLVIEGVAGVSVLVALSDRPVLSGEGVRNVTLRGIGIDGAGRSSASNGLVTLHEATNLSIDACRFINGRSNGVHLSACSGRIANCEASGFGETALFAMDSTGLVITGNRITDCANGGIRVSRSESGYDGTIVSENIVSSIRSGSGNGQNGNAISVFRAGGVIVANNTASDVDFSAIRLNSTTNCIVTGNAARECREVAIFSERAFSGSIIADNVIDGAAAGISITNFGDGGRLAVCKGNIVRNITPLSPTNPDTRPFAILAEADTAITGNVVENVPGIGIGAGWGQNLRDVLISNNIVRETDYAIVASVADGAGRARITGNLISNARKRAISAFAWTEERGTDLATAPDQFETLTVSDNTAS